MDSCNGFLLISYLSIYSGKSDYYIYNPTTKQFVIIPSPYCLPSQVIHSGTLVFNPSRALDYKIVFVLSCLDSSAYQIETYSSETGAWRFSGDTLDTTLDFDNGVFFNNTIHWPNDSFETWLLFFVDQECLTTTPMPTISDGRDKRIIKYFGESHGHLNLICSDIHIIDVLEMESDYSKWFVKYSINLDDIKATFPHCTPSYELSILHLVIGEVEEESSLVFYIPGMVVSYNFKDKN